MRHFLALLLSLAGAHTFAQQAFRLLPMGGAGSALLTNAMVYDGYDTYVAAGYVSLSPGFVERASITRFGYGYVDPASKQLATGTYSALVKAASGGYIAAGNTQLTGETRAYVCRYDANLDTLWTRNFFLASDIAYDVAEASDGSISVLLGSGFDMALLRLSAAGDLLWSKILVGISTSDASAVICQGSNTVVLGTEPVGGNSNVFLSVFDQDGTVTLHRSYGSTLYHDIFYAASVTSAGITIVTRAGPMGDRMGLIRLDNAFSLASTPSVFCISGQYLIASKILAADDGSVFIGGSRTSPYVSTVWKIDPSGSVVWSRDVNTFGAVCADMAIEGSDLIVPTTAGITPGIMMTRIDVVTGVISGDACELLGSMSIVPSSYSNFTVLTNSSLYAWTNAVFSEYAGSDMTEYSPLSVPCSITTLPVTLLYFRAFADDGVVRLDWATASERNNDYYSIERSVDGLGFTEVLRVHSLGNSQQQTIYDAIDSDPLLGTSYYRLRQTDTDGTTKIVGHVVAVTTTVSGSQVIRVDQPILIPQGCFLVDSGGQILANGGDFFVPKVTGMFFVGGEAGTRRIMVNP